VLSGILAAVEHAATPASDLLIALHYFIAIGYCIASVNLVYASYLGYRHLTAGRRMKRPTVMGHNLSSVVAATIAVLWVGASAFLVGCGWHHFQHAQHLAEAGCSHGLCSDASWASALLQAAGEVLAIAAAVFLISILGERKPPPSGARS
jgi:hypothetical protein